LGRILFFLWGFILSFLKMLLGSTIICAIVGFFFFPALYVLVPLCLIATVVEAFKGGVERAGDYLYDKKQRKHIKKLKKAFSEDELYEFDNAWKQMSRN
jgi:hypothetical protein